MDNIVSQLLDRFLRYVRIDTQSAEGSATVPSTLKQLELSRLLRGAADTTFMAVGGNVPAVPEGVRYVITLDADTQLPRGAAARLVGTLAHPLNRPRFNEALGRVTEGYGLLQPRVGVDVVSANRTAFSKVFSGTRPSSASVNASTS